MKKTLLEHHYELRIESLRDDSIADYAKRIAVVERLATEHGWKHLCERECIDIKMQEHLHRLNESFLQKAAGCLTSGGNRVARKALLK